jgi:hypothetical protein
MLHLYRMLWVCGRKNCITLIIIETAGCLKIHDTLNPVHGTISGLSIMYQKRYTHLIVFIFKSKWLVVLTFKALDLDPLPKSIV